MERLLTSITGLFCAATLATPFLLQIESALANCRVSSTASEVVRLTNQVRTQYRLKPLRFNCQLYSVAQNHTLDMVRRGKISHQGSNGSTMIMRVEKAGYRYSALGENVAQGQKTPSEVVRSWMKSPGHRQNILNPNFTEIGVGYSKNYWTQVFAKSR